MWQRLANQEHRDQDWSRQWLNVPPELREKLMEEFLAECILLDGKKEEDRDPETVAAHDELILLLDEAKQKPTVINEASAVEETDQYADTEKSETDEERGSAQTEAQTQTQAPAPMETEAQTPAPMERRAERGADADARADGDGCADADNG